jgi:hypothetical protein
MLHKVKYSANQIGGFALRLKKTRKTKEEQDRIHVHSAVKLRLH